MTESGLQKRPGPRWLQTFKNHDLVCLRSGTEIQRYVRKILAGNDHVELRGDALLSLLVGKRFRYFPLHRRYRRHSKEKPDEIRNR